LPTSVDAVAVAAADLLAAVPVGVAILDSDLRFVFVNNALADLNGVPVNDHFGRSLADVLPDLADDVVPVLERVRDTGRGLTNVELETGPLPSRPGRRRTWQITYVALRSGADRVEGIAVFVDDMTDRRETEASRDRQAFRMQRLADLAFGVAAAASVDGIADVVRALGGNPLGAWVTGLALLDGDHLRFVGAAARAHTGRWQSVRVADDQPLAVVARTGRPLFLPRPTSLLRRWPELEPLQQYYGDQAWAMLPLLRGRTVLGLLAFAFGQPYDFSTEDRQFLSSVAGLCSEAVQRAQLHEREHSIAEALQRSLLPRALPVVPGLDVASRYRAAQRSADVGGDFYDLYRDHDDQVTAVIGDVCDGGLRAAALVGQARHSLRALTRTLGPAAALRTLNDLVVDDPAARRLTTAACVRLRLQPTVTATISCGGHPRALLRRADGRVEPFGEHGTVLGVLPTVALTETTTTLSQGDCLVLYTDGVTEARRGRDQYGEERLARLLANSPSSTSETIADAILDDVLGHQPEPSDDIAVLVITVVGG
jgi:PAS domain S-box-containing protein